MYFWKIKRLKAEMAARPLSERAVLPYLVISMALFSAASFVPVDYNNLWEVIGGVWSVVLAIFGTIYIYRKNGGASGEHFLQRYFAIGWVVSVRWFVIFIIVSLAVFISIR